MVDYAIIMLAAGVFAWVASWARILPITMNVYRVVVLGRNTDCVTGVLYARVMEDNKTVVSVRVKDCGAPANIQM